MLVSNTSMLSELETDLVAMYRLLPERERQVIFDLTHRGYARIVENDETSILLLNVHRHEKMVMDRKSLSVLQHGT